MTNAKTMMTRFGAVMLVAFLVLTSMTLDAMAQGRALDVEFKEAEVVGRRGGKVAVEYVITKRSWKELRRAGIEPRLNLYVERDRSNGYNYAYSVELTKRKGRIEYPDAVSVRGTRTVELEVVGFEGEHRVDRVSFGPECATKIRLAIKRRGKTRGGPAKGARAELIATCDKHTRYDSELDRCLDEASALPLEIAASVVDVCGEQTRYASGLYQCIGRAEKLQHDPAATIKACGEATRYDSELKTCVEIASGFDYSPASVIAACDAQTRYDSGLQSCMKSARKVEGRRVARLVTACGEASSQDQGLNACIQKASGLGSDRVAIVEQCGESTRYDSELKSCIVRAASLDAPNRRERRERTTTRERRESTTTTRVRVRRASY